ncbi:hypothetical protein NE237_025762 [Protea cynaroides]|uniref:Uncharacterized protein n=1 Tax=Protea cynaroides TaxID=273540 RepID=A0A9Q0K0I1_9MAGN|nr:hypothetical protein NE237_025762 [Protea cynaroides]
MQPVKDKLSNMAGAAKEQASIARAKAGEKIETATATTPEERERAHERTMAKEAQAKMQFHEGKAERLDEKQHHPYGLHGHLHQQQHGEHQFPIPTPGGEYPMAGTTTTGADPTRPVAGQPPTTRYM